MVVRGDLVSQGIKFLNHPKVQSTAVAQKLAFLEKKGLTAEEIVECLRGAAEFSAGEATPTTTNYSTKPGSLLPVERFDRAANGNYSHCVTWNGAIFLAGQVATDPTKDVQGQTREVLANIDRLLATRGSSKSKIITCTVYIKNIAENFVGFNEVWREWVDPQNIPSRTTLEASLVSPAFLVEVTAIAAI